MGNKGGISGRHGRAYATGIAAALLLLTQGCMVGRLAGNHLLAAPNQRYRASAKQWVTVWTNLLPQMTSNSLRSFSIPVGPPNATLAAIEVPAGEYHRRFVSQINTNADGTERFILIMQRIEERRYRPLTLPATVVLLHGYGMTKESMMPWAITLAQAGFRVILLDLRGHGTSSGDYIGFGTLENRDLRQALDYLIGLGACDANVGVMGVSYGAVVALHWAAADSRVRAVVAVAPYDQVDVAVSRFVEMQKLPVPLRLLRRATKHAAHRLAIEWDDWSSSTAMRSITKPVLLIGGAEDPISRPDDIRALECTTAGTVRSIVVPRADHFVIGASFEALEVPISDWFQHCLASNGPNSIIAREFRLN